MNSWEPKLGCRAPALLLSLCPLAGSRKAMDRWPPSKADAHCVTGWLLLLEAPGRGPHGSGAPALGFQAPAGTPLPPAHCIQGLAITRRKHLLPLVRCLLGQLFALSEGCGLLGLLWGCGAVVPISPHGRAVQQARSRCPGVDSAGGPPPPGCLGLCANAVFPCGVLSSGWRRQEVRRHHSTIIF